MEDKMFEPQLDEDVRDENLIFLPQTPQEVVDTLKKRAESSKNKNEVKGCVLCINAIVDYSKNTENPTYEGIVELLDKRGNATSNPRKARIFFEAASIFRKVIINKAAEGKS